MHPTTVCCPHLACPARGHRGQGHIGLQAPKDQGCICQQGGKTCTATQGTGFSRLRPSAELVGRGVTVRAPGCPLPAIVAAFRLDERPVAAWGARSGQPGQAVQEYVVEGPRELGPGPAEARRGKTQGRLRWMALAMMGKTRLGLAGAVSAQRDMPLRRALVERGRRCALPRPRWCCPDGWRPSLRAIRATCRDPVHMGAQGRPQVRPWRHRCLAPGVKRSAQRPVVAVERRSVEGTPARVETLRRRAHGEGVVNTASIARLHAPFRERLAGLTRRGRALARHALTRQHGRSLRGTVSHFWTPHTSLRRAAPRAGRDCGQRTPARAAGSTEHGWSVRARLAYHVPPPRWIPPKQRGRPSRAWQRLIARWCS
jgi:hypothetical protein